MDWVQSVRALAMTRGLHFHWKLRWGLVTLEDRAEVPGIVFRELRREPGRFEVNAVTAYHAHDAHLGEFSSLREAMDAGEAHLRALDARRRLGGAR